MLFNLDQRLQSLRMVAGLAAFLKNPESLESVYRVAGSLQNSPLATQMLRHLLEQPAMAALVAENWRPPPLDLEALEQLPPDSLGHAYAHQMRSLGFTPLQQLHPTPTETPQQYVTSRMRETHDIVHVLTGFGVDAASELGLQAFNLAQTRSPLAVMLIFGGLLSALQQDEPLEPLLSALSRGFDLGLQADCVVAQKLEAGWDRPLADWQRQLGLPVATA
ncbi:MAG: Coq4 family protein [Cyanobium sp.]